MEMMMMMMMMKAFNVKVGVHQGSVLSPLLFIIVLDALSREGLPMELFYADDLVLMAEMEELLLEKLRKWEKGMEAKGLRVNAGKTKVMRCQGAEFGVRILESIHVVSVGKELLATQS